MEKNKAGKRIGSIKELHVAILNRMPREDLTERVTSQQRLEWDRR